MKHVLTLERYLNERLGLTRLDRLTNHIAKAIRTITKWEPVSSDDYFYTMIDSDGPQVPASQLETAELKDALEEFYAKDPRADVDLDFDDIKKELKHYYEIVSGDGPTDLVVFRRRDQKPFAATFEGFIADLKAKGKEKIKATIDPDYGVQKEIEKLTFKAKRRFDEMDATPDQKKKSDEVIQDWEHFVNYALRRSTSKLKSYFGEGCVWSKAMWEEDYENYLPIIPDGYKSFILRKGYRQMVWLLLDAENEPTGVALFLHVGGVDIVASPTQFGLGLLTIKKGSDRPLTFADGQFDIESINLLIAKDDRKKAMQSEDPWEYIELDDKANHSLVAWIADTLKSILIEMKKKRKRDDAMESMEKKLRKSMTPEEIERMAKEQLEKIEAEGKAYREKMEKELERKYPEAYKIDRETDEWIKFFKQYAAQ